MRNSASRWTLGMALSPALVGIGAFAVMFVDNIFGISKDAVTIARQSLIAAMLGGFVLAPGVGCAVAGASMTERGHKLGRRTSVIGLSLLAVGCVVIIGGVFAFAPEPAPVIVAIPFVAMIVGSVYTIRVVFRTTVPGTDSVPGTIVR